MANQLSLFGDREDDDDRIESEAKVLGLARSILTLPPPREDPRQELPGFIVRVRERRAIRAAELGLVPRCRLFAHSVLEQQFPHAVHGHLVGFL